MIRFYRSTVVGLMFLFFAATAQAQLVLVHYMPWYASKPVSGYWGGHWTMDYFDLDKVLENGQREIASHHYPLIGPYDSNDPHALECQVLLMKFAGLDGAVVYWKDLVGFASYVMIHRNSQHFVKHLKRAGLQFVALYSDTGPKRMNLSEKAVVPYGQQVMKWLADNWFDDEAYIRVDGRPVFLMFGPQFFTTDQLNQIMSGLSPRPMFYGLPHLSDEAVMDGIFSWVPVWGGEEALPDDWHEYFDYVYSRGWADESVMPIVFPGFRDIYAEAGKRPSYGFIDHQDGETFAYSFELALTSGSPIIQIATWNDYGEGTVIEPTREFGYRYLEFIQSHATTNTPYGPDALRLPVRLYKLKKKHQRHSARMEQLEQATDLLFAGKYDEGQNVIASVVEQYLITIDVNRDGTVNILDLITITQYFGQPVSSDSPADVNGDEVVDILDLVEVAQQMR